ncbi:MAG: hypothetical protein U0228_11520 [Myxococcaceae bacterium]
MRTSRLALLATLALTACPPPVTTMDSGMDVPPCDGQVGCACLANSTCTTGECLSSTCVDCRRGDLACICRSNGTCSTGLRCNTTAQRCEMCPAGQQGCACGAQDTCATGLSCSSGTCVPSTCTAGTASCPCRAGDPKCDGTLYCDGTQVCQQCSNDVAGCPCGASNDCQAGLVCDGATTRCRAAVTCADLRTNGTCIAHQACVESAGVDATCTPMACEANFKWDSRTNTCVACASANCAAEPVCDDGMDGGVQVSCRTQHRDCTQSGQVAYCAGCTQGFVDNGSGTCVATRSCGAAMCTPTEYCDTTGATPTCQPSPCPVGQAREAVGNTCRTCNLPCTADGFAGRIWPFLTTTNNCLCETLPGWFLAGGSSTLPTRCDADGDGWVNEDADAFTDPALMANARCTIRKVDTVSLVDEVGTALPLRSCAPEGMARPGQACTAPFPLRLLESPRNDTPGLNYGLTRVPLYGHSGGADAGGDGRWLEANELNGLTKACVNTVGDFNDGPSIVEDLLEVSALPPLALTNDQARLRSFSYFVELHTSYYAPPAGSAPYGTLVIAERSRCDPAFPLHYAMNDGFRDDAGTTYWRSCDRFADPTFNPIAAASTYDFAAWDVQADGGVLRPPRAHATLTAPTNPATTLLRNFGVCAMNGQPAADGVWRGMTHHSQFKCVSVVSNPTQPYERGLGDFAGGLVFNRCAARACSGTTCTETQGTGTQTLRPVVDCVPTTPSLGEVGFAAAPYRPYGPAIAGYTASTYQGGCINEDVESPDMTFGTYVCPSEEYSSVFSLGMGIPAIQKAKSDAAFGRYSCHDDLPNFLWGTAATPRAQLNWANNPGDTGNGFFR